MSAEKRRPWQERIVSELGTKSAVRTCNFMATINSIAKDSKWRSTRIQAKQNLCSLTQHQEISKAKPLLTYTVPKHWWEKTSAHWHWSRTLPCAKLGFTAGESSRTNLLSWFQAVTVREANGQSIPSLRSTVCRHGIQRSDIKAQGKKRAKVLLFCIDA